VRRFCNCALVRLAGCGSLVGYQAYLARFLERRLFVICLCNLGSINAGNLAHAVADIYLQF
jgi:hypothetical protein